MRMGWEAGRQATQRRTHTAHRSYHAHCTSSAKQGPLGQACHKPARRATSGSSESRLPLQPHNAAMQRHNKSSTLHFHQNAAADEHGAPQLEGATHHEKSSSRAKANAVSSPMYMGIRAMYGMLYLSWQHTTGSRNCCSCGLSNPTQNSTRSLQVDCGHHVSSVAEDVLDVVVRGIPPDATAQEEG